MSAPSKTPKLITAALLACVAGASAAHAATVTLSDIQVMTSNGQDFTFVFSGLEASDGTGGTLTISNGQSLTNPGAWDGLDIDSQGNSNEFFEVLVEGTSLGTYNCNSASSHTFIAGCSGGVDTQFSLALNLSPLTLANALADGSFSVVVAFSRRVNHLGDRDQVISALTYQTSEVPLPVSSLLLTTGLLGLGLVGRRRAVFK